MTRLKQLLLAALATSTRAAWRLDSKMTRPTKLLLATLAAAAATPWPRLDEALKNYPSIHARSSGQFLLCQLRQPSSRDATAQLFGDARTRRALLS